MRAARTIVVRDGLRGLTFDAIAAEAGEYRAAVRYYFGTKRNLIAALVESLTPQATIDAVAGVAERLPAGDERVRAQVSGWQTLVSDREAAQALFEVFPLVVRDRELRERVAGLYRHYRELDVRRLRRRGVTARRAAGRSGGAARGGHRRPLAPGPARPRRDRRRAVLRGARRHAGRSARALRGSAP